MATPQAKTFDEFAYDAAETLLELICQMRVLKVRKPSAFGAEGNEGLRRLEKVAGSHTPHRTAECGDCPGCSLSRIINTVH